MKTLSSLFVTLCGAIFAVFFFTPALVSASTEVSGMISPGTVWTSANSPYIVGYAVIPAGVTLTVEEGIVIKFLSSPSTLEVNGNLVVRGTEAHPVYFTSINDNTVGGEIGTGAPAQGDWGNIVVNEGGMAQIDRAVIRYGGYTPWAPANICNRGGTITVSNSVIGNSQNGLMHLWGATTLERNTITENRSGIFSTGTGSISLVGNTFLDNTESAVFLDLSSGIAFAHSENTATGGTQPGFYMRGNLPSGYTFEKDTMPYIVGYLIIPAGQTATARPGTVFKFGDIASHVRISGNFRAEGTETEPIYFTSIKDDTIFGDTNGDGEATHPEMNDWAEMIILSGGQANFDRAVIRYGGQYSWGVWTNASSLSNQGGTLNISNSDISNGNIGIRHLSGTTAIASSTFSKNGIGVYGDGTGLLAFIGNTFIDNPTAAYLDLSRGFSLSNSGNIAFGTGNRGFTIHGTVNSDRILTKDGVPYLVSYISVLAKRTLVVSPGTVMKMTGIGSQISVTGTLRAEGTQFEPIYFTSLKDDTILGDTNGDGKATSPAPSDWAEIAVTEGGAAHFTHTVIRYGGQYSWGVWTNNAELANRGGTLDIENSEIAYGNIGVYHQNGTTTVAQSSIHNNDGYGIYDVTTKVLHAENNWWGGVNGPYHPLFNVAGIGNNQVSSYIAFTPWLGSDPFATSSLTLGTPTQTEDDGNQDTKGVADKTKFVFSVTVAGTPDVVNLIVGSITGTTTLPLTGGPMYVATSTFPKGKYTWHIEASTGGQTTQTPDQNFTTGYSNVAFLPGLEASRLYQTVSFPGVGTVEVKKWEPRISHDNSVLYLYHDGTPQTPGLYTKDVINEALGANIYESFIDSMDNLVDAGTIHAWKPLPYDWRFDVRDIVDHPIALESGSYSMTEEIQKLAESSDTGKVTLIAHSNGGLVSKVLANKLGADGSKLLDQMIFVASPQAGTPQAVGAILHGYNQGLPKDWFPLLINSKEARDLARNMPSAYGLLPSAQYFTYVDDPVITFDNDPLLTDWRTKYGIEIHSAETLRNFLADQTRSPMPVTEETKNPIIGNETLLNSAENLHNTILDNWTPPEGVALTQIAGWGEDTMRTIVYYQGIKTVCANPGVYSTCASAPALEYSIKEVLDGDGTVVVPSALWTSGAGRYWVDLQTYNETHFDRKHADILEVQELQEFVKNLIVRNNVIPDNYIATSAPVNDSPDKQLRFALHSPLNLDLYDNLGNHTGISTTTGALEENIPGSRYKTFGELKYISVPPTTNLHLAMNGYATGSFTLDMEEFLGDTVIASTTFAGIPSSTSTVATITLPDGNIAGSSPLSVDENGDGTPELILAPKLDGIVTLPKPILTVIANNQAITLGLPIPSLSATLSPIPNDVTGTPDCTTTATASSTVGTYPIICAIGTLASNTYDFAFTTGTLSITYRFDGFLQPINDIAYHPAQAPSVFKGGSTVPVKFQIKNSDGTPVQASTLPTFSFQRSNAMSASVDESTYTDPATTGTTFRWDSAAQQYIYNWSTKGVAPGYWYKLSVKLDDGKTYSVVVGLR